MTSHSASNSTRAPPVDGSSIVTRRMRGETRCIANDRIVDAFGKMTPDFCPETFKGVGKVGTRWTTELGWIARYMSPLQVKAWKDIPKPRKAAMLARLKDKFEWNESDPQKNTNILDSIDRQLNKSWKDWRCRMHAYFKDMRREIDPEEAKKHRHKQVMEQEDWDWLCDYWSTNQFKKKSATNAKNREKKKDPSV